MIYLRISQDREADGLAIERQREDCENLARFRRWGVVETYVDVSKSATDKTKARPGYDRMVADWESGAFDAIVCWDLDRLTRQPRQLEDWIDRAEERGLALVTANGDADLSTDGGRMYARIKAAVARAEMERKSARQKAAHQQRARQGRPPKGVRPLGYDIAGDQIPAEAHAVAAMYTAFLGEKGTLRGIARALSGDSDEHHFAVPQLPRHSYTLNQERNSLRREANRKLPNEKRQALRPAPCAPDAPWPESSVLEILRNPRYCGYSVYTQKKDRRKAVADNAEKQRRLDSGTATDEDRKRSRRRSWRDQLVLDDDGQPIMGQWNPIVDVTTWQAVQAKLDDARRVTNNVGTARRHIGSGLYLCGVCNLPLRGSSRGYRCRTDGHVNRTGVAIDDYVTKIVVARLSEPDAFTTVTAATSPQLTSVLAALDVQHARIARAERDYAAEAIEAVDLKRVRNAARAEIEDLERQSLALSRGAVSVPLLGTEDPTGAFLGADLAGQRLVIEALLTVTVRPAPRGRKGFDHATVGIAWKR
ncbi:recombinase family protein [Gordonia sp. HY285]|uniref:recombinase family protein n=1 Tax=Gordonia liuliyuniae TaxID=2911517 RepID=UPI001F262CC8|nr:recombinase family protein [Gordonia liuliyuniae]MCF8610187.1 recombinase family protein [Gordonia liuliyuniae]